MAVLACRAAAGIVALQFALLTWLSSRFDYGLLFVTALFSVFAGGPTAPGPVLGMLLRKRIQLRATTLRARSDAYKASLAAGVAANVMPRITAPSAAASVSPAGDVAATAGADLQPVIEATLDGLESVSEAFARMRRSENLGKYVIRVASE